VNLPSFLIALNQDETVGSVRSSIADHLGVSVGRVSLELDSVPMEDDVTVQMMDLFNRKESFKVHLSSSPPPHKETSPLSSSAEAWGASQIGTLTVNMPSGNQEQFHFPLDTDKIALGNLAKEFCESHRVHGTDCPSTIFTAASEQQDQQKHNAAIAAQQQRAEGTREMKHSPQKLVRRKIEKEPQLETIVRQLEELRAEIIDIKLQNIILRSEVDSLKRTSLECCEISYD
jgi:hypothetical protein